MVKLTIILSLIMSLQNSCNNQNENLQTVKYVISDSQNSVNEWYEIIEQFPNKLLGKKPKTIYSSAYLCIRLATKDTVWVLTPNESLKYKDGIKAQLYFDNNTAIGDTLSFQLKNDLYLNYIKHDKVIGTLKVPTN